MGQQRQEKGYYTFVKGLVTEASPLTAPQDTSLDEVNFDLLIDGSRKRRLGVDYEEDYDTLSATVTSSTRVTAHKWSTAAGQAANQFVVLQLGYMLYFYDNVHPISANQKGFTYDLRNQKVSGTSDAALAAEPVAVASGKGYLFVVQKYVEPFYLVYDPDGDSITAVRIQIWMRLFDRLTSDYIANPTSLSDVHQFDLLNNGWTSTLISGYQGAHGYYPNLTRIPSTGYYIDTSTGLRSFSYAEINSYDWGNTPAPNGHLIINPFNTSAIFNASNSLAISSFVYDDVNEEVDITVGTAHGLSVGDPVTINNNRFEYSTTPAMPDPPGETSTFGSLNGSYTVKTVGSTTEFTIDFTIASFDHWIDQYVSKGTIFAYTIVNPLDAVETTRFTSVGFFAGRVWFGGTDITRLSSKVFYSQIIESDSNIGSCFSAADPTREEEAQVVDTDGGVLTIPEMGQLRGFLVVGDKLVLMASNGVWSIGGSADTYFKATSYAIRHLVQATIPENQHGLLVDQLPLLLAREGVFGLEVNQISGDLVGRNIIETSIQSLWDDIPTASLNYAQLTYDGVAKRLCVLYDSTGAAAHKHNTMLIFDSRLKAWSKWSMPASNPYVAGAIDLYSNVDPAREMKLVVVDTTNNKVTFGNFWRTDWLDWYSYDSVGVDAPGYLITNYDTASGPERRHWGHYLHVFLNRTETTWTDVSGEAVPLPASSCLASSRWDFHITDDGGKFSATRQVYRHRRNFVAPDTLPAAFDPGYRVVYTRNKLRGTGRAIQLKFETEAGKDCHIYGWHLGLNTNTDL